MQPYAARVSLLVVEGNLLVDMPEADVEAEEGSLGRHKIPLGTESSLLLILIVVHIIAFIKNARQHFSFRRPHHSIAPNSLQEL